MTTTDPGRTAWRRDIGVFLAGQSISLFGSMVVQYAVVWYLTLTTKDGTVLALATIVAFVPQAVVSIFGGVWADRHNRKLLIMASDATIAAATLALALLMIAGTTSVPLLCVALAVRSAGAGVQTPAVGALLPQLVPQDKLLTINGLNQSIQAAMMLVAPALAALLYASIPLEAIFFVDVTTAVVGIGLLATIPVARVSRADGHASYLADLVEGVRYVRSHRLVRWLLTLSGAVMVLAAAPAFLTPLMVVRSFGEEVWKLTALEISFSVGMMLAGATIGSWGKGISRIHLLLGSSAAFGALSIAMGLSSVLWVFYAFMFLVGVAVPGYATPSMTLLQETVEPERQGRVFGFYGIVTAVAMPLGMAIFGPLADLWTVQTVLVLAGVATLLVVAAFAFAPSGRRVARASASA